MRNYLGERPRTTHVLPPLGWRIIKTTIAVFLILMVYSLLGFREKNMPTEACITAIICMQPYVKDSGTYAFNRFAGTFIGAFWGLLLLLLLTTRSGLGASLTVLYSLMALGTLLSLYSCVVLRAPDASGQAAIVFLCVVIAFPDIQDPLRQAGWRFLDVFLGTVAAIFVNIFHLPRRKNRDLLLFIHTEDLVPDLFTPLAPAVLFQLNYLYGDGARLCLMSRHAPAFFALQMSGARLATPLIVMDGAAIYDADRANYLQKETIAPEDSQALRQRLEELGISYFTYTIHRDRVCVFHNGDYRPEEQQIYDRMRHSPYRDYLEGEIYDPAEIVYIKVIVPDDRVPELERQLSKAMPKGKLRRVSRPQPSAPGVSGLYIYAHTATLEQAQKRVADYLRESEPRLRTKELRGRSAHPTDRDAIHLMHRVRDAYEPIWPFGGKKE